MEVLARCEVLAGYSEEPDKITRTFLCPAMRGVHQCLDGWMRAAGMAVRLDQAGNLIGRYPAAPGEDAPVFLIGSHLDSVPDPGKYDRLLGLLLGGAAVQAVGGERLPLCPVGPGFFREDGG